jgi:hypothetical protein
VLLQSKHKKGGSPPFFLNFGGIMETVSIFNWLIVIVLLIAATLLVK